MTYIAAEPDEITAYVDSEGVVHKTRCDALNSNFKRDVNEAISQIYIPMSQNYSDDEYQTKFVLEFIKQNPDIVRVLLGDRDST